MAQFGSALDWGSRGRRFKSCQPDYCDVSGHWHGLNLRFGGSGFFVWADGLVIAGGVDGEFADDLAGVGVDDGAVLVVDEHGDAGSLGNSTGAVYRSPDHVQGLGGPGYQPRPAEHDGSVSPRSRAQTRASATCWASLGTGT